MKIHKGIITLVSLVLLITAGIVCAASSSDIDKLTTYAVMLGRGIACNAEGIQTVSRRVGAWMDRKFPPGSEDQLTYLPIFMEGVQYNAQQQKSGNSPDSCATVNSEFEKANWP